MNVIDLISKEERHANEATGREQSLRSVSFIRHDEVRATRLSIYIYIPSNIFQFRFLTQYSNIPAPQLNLLSAQ